MGTKKKTFTEVSMKSLEKLKNLNEVAVHAGLFYEYPQFEIFRAPTDNDFRTFELAARTCYASEEKMSDDLSSAEKLLNKILKFDHTAMLEFMGLTVRFRTSRGVSHEIVRHRLCSFAQSSTRYIKYGTVPFIIPWWANVSNLNLDDKRESLFLSSCAQSAKHYSERIGAGCSPQEARGSLNNDVATHINVQANVREWLTIFKLRCDTPAHPDMRVLMLGLLTHLYLNSDIFKIIIQQAFPAGQFLTWANWFDNSWRNCYTNGVYYIVPVADL